MKQTPVKPAISACLLSHCTGTEFQNCLKIQAFWFAGGDFHGPCCPIQAQRLNEVPSNPERTANNARAYNALITSWSEIMAKMSELGGDERGKVEQAGFDM